MATIIENYPILSENTKNSMLTKSGFIATYNIDGDFANIETMKIDKLGKDEEYFISCPKGNWDPSNDNLKITGFLCLKNLNSLFVGNSKICDESSTIGLAINAYSKSSKYNITIPFDEIKYDENRSEDVEFVPHYQIEFENGKLSDTLFISIFLYLKKCDVNSMIFANDIGSNLGEIYNCSIKIEGNGSLFPIKIINDKDKPLWSMNLDFESIEDEFSEKTICIKLNSAVDDFKKIQDDVNEENSAIWKEIMGAFFTQFLVSIDESELEDVFSGDFINDNSIGEFAKYIIDNFEITMVDLSTITVLSEKIRKKLDEVF